MREASEISSRLIWTLLCVTWIKTVGGGGVSQCQVSSELLSPIDIIYPKVNHNVGPVTITNLDYPIRYREISSSLQHVTLEPSLSTETQSSNGSSTGDPLAFNDRVLPRLSGGPLPAGTEYKLGQVTFSMESRHWFSGRHFPLEAEFYFYKSTFGSLNEALRDAGENGPPIAALGLLFKSDYSNNGKEKSNIFLDNDIYFYTNDILPEKTGAYYFYNGSYIESSCEEPVIWIMDKKIRSWSPDHFSILKSRMNDDPDISSYERWAYKERSSVHPLGEYRQVYSSKGVKAIGSKSVYQKKPNDMDHFFLFIMSIIIFFMQCGFAFMEAGAVKSKNTVNILIKNWLDVCIGALVYWATGFALTHGTQSNSFISSSYFFGHNMPTYKLSKWFFNFVFAATAATLVSGSLAERCNFIAYIVYSVMITGFIYPVIAHWAWHRDGWLHVAGFHDFAGSGVVHLCGATCALVGCILVGPRIGRFDPVTRVPVRMPGHSVPLSALGGFILIFGFFACNGAKQGSISNPEDGVIVVQAIVNTALGTSAAGLSTLVFSKSGWLASPGTIGGKYSLLDTINGSLTGTIALCAGCDLYPLWASVVIGLLCGPLFLCLKALLLKLGIDDPLDGIPVHGGGGILGLLAVNFFTLDGIFATGSLTSAKLLGWNIVGALAIVTWTGVTCFIMFFVLKKLNLLRVEPDMEFQGMDLIKHGEAAYPAEAWVERQYGGASGSKSQHACLPPNMRGHGEAAYNDPKAMFPSAARLFTSLRRTAEDTQNNIVNHVPVELMKKRSSFAAISAPDLNDDEAINAAVGKYQSQHLEVPKLALDTTSTKKEFNESDDENGITMVRKL